MHQREQPRSEIVGARTGAREDFEKMARSVRDGVPRRGILARRTRRVGPRSRAGHKVPVLPLQSPESQSRPGEGPQRRKGVPEVAQQRGSVIQIVFPRSLNAT